MTEWIETYRGVVSAWECDIVEHFTIAYYFERFAEATRNFFELVDEAERLSSVVEARPSRLYTSFSQELRAGAGFHILSAVVGLDESSLRLGHQVIYSSRAETVSWVMEILPLPASATPELRRRLEANVVAWPGPQVPAAPRTARRGALTARDRVKPRELGEDAGMALAAHVHRFSGAGMQFLSSIGMTGDYMHQNRRGFSTLALDLRLSGVAGVGDRIDVETGIAHLGNTSLSYLHRMRGADGREIASMLQTGVQLDLDARRPAPLPPVIREAVSRLLAQA
ncbi:MAG TPA: thioesterase family protein [Hyphomicrobiaceae bacterium]|jgi:acyl-CoA thioesterase FadM|nr:thioesterase family protein [Hyphomicrobiaceae bacterium]